MIAFLTRRDAAMLLKKLSFIILCVFYYLISLELAFGLDHGLLWQIESPNGKISKVFGTMHLIDKDMNILFNHISHHIKQSRIVFIEYTLDKNDSSSISGKLVNTNRAIETRLSNKELHALKKFLKSNNIPFNFLKNASPSLIYGYLINPKSINNLPIDFMIGDFAVEQNIPVQGLEPAREVFERMLILDDSFFSQALKNTLSHVNLLPSYRKKMKSLYFNEDLIGIINSLTIPEISPKINNNYMKSLINERNLNMFHRAQHELDLGDAFIAVGAAHLGGEQGLLNLLKKAGYKIFRHDIAITLS